MKKKLSIFILSSLCIIYVQAQERVFDTLGIRVIANSNGISMQTISDYNDSTFCKEWDIPVIWAFFQDEENKNLNSLYEKIRKYYLKDYQKYSDTTKKQPVLFFSLIFDQNLNLKYIRLYLRKQNSLSVSKEELIKVFVDYKFLKFFSELKIKLQKPANLKLPIYNDNQRFFYRIFIPTPYSGFLKK